MLFPIEMQEEIELHLLQFENKGIAHIFRLGKSLCSGVDWCQYCPVLQERGENSTAFGSGSYCLCTLLPFLLANPSYSTQLGNIPEPVASISS